MILIFSAREYPRLKIVQLVLFPVQPKTVLQFSPGAIGEVNRAVIRSIGNEIEIFIKLHIEFQIRNPPYKGNSSYLPLPQFIVDFQSVFIMIQRQITSKILMQSTEHLVDLCCFYLY
jgi:hypothetical protein